MGAARRKPTENRVMKKYLAILLGVALVAGTTVGDVVGQERKPDERKTDAPGPLNKSEDGRKSDAGTTAKPKTITGSVKSTADDGIVVSGVEKGQDREWAFSVDEKTTIRKGEKAVSRAELKAGDSVTVSYTDAGGKVVARTVTVKESRGDAKTDAKGRPASRQ
jgi:hypothetical protein